MEKEVKTWTCICGRVHLLDGKPIYCGDGGHKVYIAPERWTYKVKEIKEQAGQQQLKLL